MFFNGFGDARVENCQSLMIQCNFYLGGYFTFVSEFELRVDAGLPSFDLRLPFCGTGES